MKSRKDSKAWSNASGSGPDPLAGSRVQISLLASHASNDKAQSFLSVNFINFQTLPFFVESNLFMIGSSILA